MNIFEEYLDDWDFDPGWRPAVERLAERTRERGNEGGILGTCAIWPLPEPVRADGPAPALVWCDVLRPGGQGGVTLGGLLWNDSISCGTVNGHCVDDLDSADLTWASHRIAPGESSRELGEFFANWLLDQTSGPVDALVERRSAFVRANVGRWRR